MSEEKKKWDDDIARMELDELEKSTLQFYRNYQEAFLEHAIKHVATEIDAKPLDVVPLKKVLTLIVSEDARFLPTIACAYADDALAAMFKEHVRDSIPYGRSTLFGMNGPISTFYQRLQLAYAFRLLPRDLVESWHRVREVRNDISHTWDLETFKDFYEKEPASKLFPDLEALKPGMEFLHVKIAEGLKPVAIFRVRLVWLLTRLAYETAYTPLVMSRRLPTDEVLFGKNPPKQLGVVAFLARDFTKLICEAN